MNEFTWPTDPEQLESALRIANLVYWAIYVDDKSTGFIRGRERK